jgi:SAM-dependent methyltransferase
MTIDDNPREIAVAETGGLTPAIPVDVEVLRDEIQKTYTDVSDRPADEFIFPTGRAWAEDLGYPGELLDRIPDRTLESFAGVANHFKLGQINPGETVLDLGCGAGTDLLIAAQMASPAGKTIGIDMTPAMVQRARESATAMGLENVELHEGMIERVPVPDESVDVVISNGVIDLVPDKEAVFSEIWRVLRGHGRLQIADVTIRRPVSDEGKRNIDLWTG